MENSEPAVDRTVFLAALWASAKGTRVDRARLSLLAARAGAAEAAAHRDVARIVAEFDAVERLVLENLVQRMSVEPAQGATELLPAIVRLHEQCARMRRAAVLAHGRSLHAAARAKLRELRHDATNAIGAVRNALLMLDTEVDATLRGRLREIAMRNSSGAEHLIRSGITDALVPDDQALAAEASAFVLDELRAEQPLDADERAIARALAALLGVSLDFDDDGGRPLIDGAAAPSPGNERNDLRRERERDHLDSLGL